MNQSFNTQKSPPVLLMCLALFGLPAGVCVWHNDFVCAALLVAVGIGCMSGFKIGAVRSLATLAGIVAAVWYAPQFSGQVELKLTEWISTTGLTNRLLALGLSGGSIVLIAVLAASLVSGWILRRNSGLNALNSWAGFLLGGVKASVGLLLLLGGLMVVQPMLPVPPSSEASVQASIKTNVDVLMEQTQRSSIGPFLRQHNPFVKFPQLNRFAEVQNTFAVIQDPMAIKRLINDPQIKALQEDPSMQEAITLLKSDKTINRVLRSGGLKDEESVMAVMNSPVVLHLLDQPGFLTAAAKVIDGMKQ